MRTKFVDVGSRVQRKRDKAAGVIVDRTQLVPSAPGSRFLGKTLLTIRLDDAVLAKASGGDMTGDLGWFTTYFRAL